MIDQRWLREMERLARRRARRRDRPADGDRWREGAELVLRRMPRNGYRA
jgi:hypothetical protein